MNTLAILFLLLIYQPCSATRMCPRCISLEYLLVPTLGIELSSRESSLAIAFHNGTVSHIASIKGSPQYQEVMTHFRNQSSGSHEALGSFCRQDSQPEIKSGFMDVLYRFCNPTIGTFRSMVWPSQATCTAATAPEPEDPETLVLHESIKSLLSSSDESFHTSSSYVGLAIPEWITESQGCKIRRALALAGKEIGTVEYAPAAAFAAFGYELCFFDSEWLPCPAPGRIMTLRFDEEALIASLSPTPYIWWFRSKMTYALNETLGLEQADKVFVDKDEAAKAMAEWIDEFVENQRPDKAILVGRLTDQSVLREAAKISKISSLVVENPMRVDLGDVIALGVAKIMKDTMESQGEDCIEDEECEKIREEANRLAGSTTFSSQEQLYNRIEL